MFDQFNNVISKFNYTFHNLYSENCIFKNKICFAFNYEIVRLSKT